MLSSTSQMLIIFLLLQCACTINSLTGRGSLNHHVRCNEKDRYVLSKFRQGIQDPLKKLSSWSTEEDCCKWAGVLCDNIASRVNELNLPNFGITGEINFYLFEIEFLSYLDLSLNDIKAIHFPHVNGHANDQRSHNASLEKTISSTTNFSNLLYLDISENSNLYMDNLRWVSHFPSMKYLNLGAVTINHETFSLQEMIMLPSLVELRLSDCSLTGFGVSPSLQYVNFTSLSLAVFDISFNSIDAEIPNWLFNISGSLSFMDLRLNQLQGQIPATLINSQHLKTLDLSANNLNGSIPEWMGQFKHLEYLDLSDNLFSGPIPASFGNLSSVKSLYAAGNRLNGNLPSDFGRLSTLEELSIGYNSLSGNLSEKSFGNLSKLKLLFIEANAFTFNFDTHWQPLFQLQSISMSNCKVGPEFPSWLYTQRSLSFLDSSSSGLSFTAHDEFWRFVAQIDCVFLYNNSISGDISILLINNTELNLETNNLTGNLPRLSPEVFFFSIADNRLSGPISPSLCYSMIDKSELEFLDLSNNILSGEFPDCWMQWEFLRHLNLGSNNLTGEIPESIGSLIELRTLRLHNNTFFGNVPASLQRCKQLWFLELAFNEFTGNIPTWFNKQSMTLLLRSNKFNGSIPSDICQLSNLAVLDLANNRLSGSIPKCLYNITMMATNIPYHNDDLSESYADWVGALKSIAYFENLKLFVKGRESDYKENFILVRFVDLSDNDFSGLIPPELFNLFALQSLNLSHNHLKGVIPSEVGHMRFLESLDLSNNLLSGEIPESMSNLSFLNQLNLSYNNFKGRIPLGTQLQSFDAFSYTGNPELCGAPLPKNCTQGDNNNGSKWMEDKDNDFRSWFDIGLGVGFAFGFWGVFGTLLFIRRWRHAYFQVLDHIYVFIAMKMNSVF